MRNDAAPKVKERTDLKTTKHRITLQHETKVENILDGYEVYEFNPITLAAGSYVVRLTPKTAIFYKVKQQKHSVLGVIEVSAEKVGSRRIKSVL